MTDSAAPTFACARYIKEIGRGPNGARALSHEDTYALYEAILDDRVSELELGAVLLAYRVKGETAAELAAMLAAAHRSFEPLHVQDGREHARPCRYRATTARARRRISCRCCRFCSRAKACRCWCTASPTILAA